VCSMLKATHVTSRLQSILIHFSCVLGQQSELQADAEITLFADDVINRSNSDKQQCNFGYLLVLLC